MTEGELSKIPLRMVGHMAMEHEHCSSYVNDEYGIGVCKHVTKKNGYGFGRSYTRYMYKGVVYKSRKKFLESYNSIKDNNRL